MNQIITEEALNIEVHQSITACYERNTFKRIDMVVNPAKRRIRFDVIDDVQFEIGDKPAYSGQSLKHAIKIYNGINQNGAS